MSQLMKGIMYFGMDTEANLQAENPVIPAGMIVLATDDNGNIKMKFGSVTGTLKFNELPYYVNENTLTATASATTYGVTMLANSLDINNTGLSASSSLTYELNEKIKASTIIDSGETIDETYGRTWYNVFGNGFCIQGGGVVKSGTWSSDSASGQYYYTVPMLKEFKDSNWVGYANVAGGGCEHMSVVSVYSNSILQVTKTTASARNFGWVAYGYVDI